MKTLVKKCIGYALIFGFTLPALGYKWTIYNGLPEEALVQLNVTAQVMHQPIPSGGSALFNYDTYGGWHNILNMSGLCLTTIVVMPMGGDKEEFAHFTKLTEDTFEHAIKALPDLIKAIENAAEIEEDPLKVIPAIVDAFKFLEEIIGMLIELVGELCNDGTWLITKNPKTGEMQSIHKG